MKVLVTINASKEAPRELNDLYSFREGRRKPQLHEIYTAIQRFLSSQGFEVTGLSVEEKRNE